MPIYYLTTEEIIKLKRELMNKRRSKSLPYYSKNKNNNRTFNSSKSFSQLFHQTRNSEIGYIFEDNIRHTLNIEYHWKNVLKKRRFFYRIITIGKRRIFIQKGYKKKTIVNRRRFKFTLNENGSLSIYSGAVMRRFIRNIKENNKKINIFLNDKEITISREKEVEIDGFFKIQSKFDNIFGNDIISLYNNIDDEELDNANYACCEIKLNKAKINSLVQQLRNDKDILENMFRFKRVIYVGFVGTGFIDRKILNKLKAIKSIKFIILEIKNFIWLKRDLTNYIDWATIAIMSELKEKWKELDNKLNIIIKALGIEQK